jgi:hypothetical protein
MRPWPIVSIAAVLAGFTISDAGAVTSYRGDMAGASAAAHRPESAWRLHAVQTESRSYMHGRGFQSYQRDRGFAGERNFGSYPSARGDGRADRLYSLKRRHIHGPSQDRCAGWARRCDQQAGDAPGDYESCLRYHGCR